MNYRLSLLDQSPIAAGATAAAALAQTTSLARLAEAAGYHRFWVSEHHNSATLAGSAPEILAAWLLAHTRTIRIGSGGVMLQHYSPYKVAENFHLLSALAPDRVDLGVGKAPGGLPLSTRALQQEVDASRQLSFEDKLRQLNDFWLLMPRSPLSRTTPSCRRRRCRPSSRSVSCWAPVRKVLGWRRRWDGISRSPGLFNPAKLCWRMRCGPGIESVRLRPRRCSLCR